MFKKDGLRLLSIHFRGKNIPNCQDVSILSETECLPFGRGVMTAELTAVDSNSPKVFFLTAGQFFNIRDGKRDEKKRCSLGISGIERKAVFSASGRTSTSAMILFEGPLKPVSEFWRKTIS